MERPFKAYDLDQYNSHRIYSCQCGFKWGPFFLDGPARPERQASGEECPQCAQRAETALSKGKNTPPFVWPTNSGDSGEHSGDTPKPPKKLKAPYGIRIEDSGDEHSQLPTE